MADIRYQSGIKKIIDHNDADTINLLSDTLQVMLVDATYTGDADNDWVDDGTANDPASHEIAVTGYTAGYAGTGRKTLAGKTLTVDDVNNVVIFDATDVVWTALGAGATIGAVILYKRGASDAASQLIAKFDVTDGATNGTDVTQQWSASGLIDF
jgi:hypothetical protein